MTYINHYFKKITCLLIMVVLLCLNGLAEEQGKNKKQKEEKQQPIIEEVEVTGKIPAQLPLSSISLIENKELAVIAPKNLGEIMNYTSGVYVTEGAKNESSIKIRGLSSNRITLMYDGIPIYEPYFNSFDLKSVAASGIENIKVIKGTHSVLYGPNTLGGVINLVTQRPSGPFLSLDSNFSENSTYFVSGSLGTTWEKFAVIANASLDQADGFKWNRDGEQVTRENSDYHRKNFSGKFYFYPSENSEIMAQVIYYTADYGIPAATEYVKSRYWRFKDWDRWQVNLGGMFPFLGKGLFKIRSYYVYHFNVLDAYRSLDLQNRQWESTYKNDSLGAFMLGEYPLTQDNNLKFSVNISKNQVRQQGDIGEEWEEYNREIYSAAIEDHWNISEKWKIVGGASVDYLVKNNDDTESRLNPIIGLKFTPKEWLDFHLSFSRKTRFPSMRALYSSDSGNPNLTSELGNNYEIGFSYKKSLWLSGAVFYQRITDMIQSYRGLDGYRNYQNIGRAELTGLELELGKRIGMFDFSLNYTYLNTVEKDLDEPLDYAPKSQFNGFLNIGDIKGFSLSFWGIAVSGSQAKLGNEPPFEIVAIPGYVLVNARLAKQIGIFSLYVKAENLLDKAYFAEPGYPMKARTFMLGFGMNLK
jgi:outer membrane receptor protein involved in Fe transport